MSCEFVIESFSPPCFNMASQLREIVADLEAISEYAKQLIDHGDHSGLEAMPQRCLRLEEEQELLQHVLICASIVH